MTGDLAVLRFIVTASHATCGAYINLLTPAIQLRWGRLYSFRQRGCWDGARF